MVSRKVSVLGANVLKFLCCRVHDLDITSDVSITVDFAELIEGLVCNVGNVQLMISYVTFNN